VREGGLTGILNIEGQSKSKKALQSQDGKKYFESTTSFFLREKKKKTKKKKEKRKGKWRGQIYLMKILSECDIIFSQGQNTTRKRKKSAFLLLSRTEGMELELAFFSIPKRGKKNWLKSYNHVITFQGSKNRKNVESRR